MIRPRKCRLCGRDIIFERDRDNCLMYSKAFYHVDCFVKSKKECKSPWSEDRLGVFLPPVIEETKQFIDQKLSEEMEKERKKALAKVDECKRKAFFDFIRDTYAPAIVPGKFYARLQKIVFGTDPKVAAAIPAQYLHDEWRRLLPELNRIYKANEGIGKNITERWNYDLAVVLNKYPSYLAWRKNQEQQHEEAKSTAQMLKTAKKMNPPAQPVQPSIKTENDSEIDISYILDEI